MKEKLTCYIVDDEHLAQRILEEYIAKVHFLELKGSFNSPLEAVRHIAEDKPDLLFLDINMPDVDGISFISMLNPRPLVILTTAYDQYALQAYELEVKDYLLKPFSFERFYKGVLRIHQQQNSIQSAVSAEVTLATEQGEEYIFLKVGHRIQRITLKDIVYIQGMKSYLRFYTAKENFMTLMSFTKLEELLPSHGFARVHKSYVVAIGKIDHIEKNRIWIADQIIPISETYSEGFFKLLKGFQ